MYGGLRRSTAVVRGAIPPGRVRGIPVGVNDPGYVEPPRPTRIDSMTPPRVITGAAPHSPGIFHSSGYIGGDSPVRSITHVSPSRVVSHHSPPRMVTGHRHSPSRVVHSGEREVIRAHPGNPIEPVTTMYPPKEYVTRTFSPARHNRFSTYSPARGSITSYNDPYGGYTSSTYQPGYESHMDTYEPPVEKVTRHFTPPRAVTTMPPRYVGTSNFVRSPDIPMEVAMGRTYYDGVSTTYGDPGKVRIERDPDF